MWAARLFSLIYRQPILKRLLWRSWYNFVSDRYRNRAWTFMNYGHGTDLTRSPLALLPEDEPDRCCIQLYQVIAGSVDLVGKEVLEVGSGRGGGTSFVMRYLRPARMVGVDLSWRAVAFCRKRHPHANLSFQVGNAERLALKSASFDAVLNVESSHCYGDIEAFLREVRRVLRPGGYFLYADFRARDEVAAWRRRILDSGMELVQEQDITSGVVSALEDDDQRKRRMIEKIVDLPLRNVFRKFAALRGTQLYDDFRQRTLVYCLFVLRAPARQDIAGAGV